MQIAELVLKVGTGDGQALRLPLGPSITVFVGPNNSGKSVLLREIATYCQQGNSGQKILDHLEFLKVDKPTALRELDQFTDTTSSEPHQVGHRRIVAAGGYENIAIPTYLSGRLNPTTAPHHYAQTFGRHFIRQLDGPSRLSLINSHPIGDLKRPSQLLTRLLVDKSRRSLVRERIYNQLGMYLALDITDTSNVHACLGASPPPNERSFDEPTVDYMRQVRRISEFSDGVKAFCGLMVHVHVGAPRVITVDEPEAFLAPPLAHALGKELANGALAEGKQVFVATHSSNFLMGAISTGAPVNIVRLTYDGVGTARARLLQASELSKLMYDPMLRSANVLSALFYRGVVIGEADADRAFYQECNERMLSEGDSRAAADTLFLNANGKDVVPMILGPLRRLGIPAASILDLDVLNQGGEVWTRHLKACGIPSPDHQPFGSRRSSAISALEAADRDYKRRGGVAVLSGDERASADALMDELVRYGMFVVRRGEVEAWLSDLDAPRAKHSWLRAIFERMGSDPSHLGYVRPAPGDVWEFLGAVSAWLADTHRRGMGA